MLLPFFMKLRATTHTLFGGFEHLCAVGYALHEFKIEAGKLLLIFGSMGLLLFAVAVILDHVLRHWPAWQKCLRWFHARQYRELL